MYVCVCMCMYVYVFIPPYTTKLRLNFVSRTPIKFKQITKAPVFQLIPNHSNVVYCTFLLRCGALKLRPKEGYKIYPSVSDLHDQCNVTKLKSVEFGF